MDMTSSEHASGSKLRCVGWLGRHDRIAMRSRVSSAIIVLTASTVAVQPTHVRPPGRVDGGAGGERGVIRRTFESFSLMDCKRGV